MDNTNRIAKSLESIDRTLKALLEELRRSNAAEDEKARPKKIDTNININSSSF